MSDSPEDVDARLGLLMEYFGDRLNRVFAYFFFVREFRDDQDHRSDPALNDRAWCIQTIENACIDSTLMALRDLDDFLRLRTTRTKPDDIRASDFNYPGSHAFLTESQREDINKRVAHTTTVGADSPAFRWDILELATKGVAQGVAFLHWVEKEYGFACFDLCIAATAIRTRTESILTWISKEAEWQSVNSTTKKE